MFSNALRKEIRAGLLTPISGALIMRCMKLSEFFDTHGAQAALAKSMEVPAPMLSQWASGARPVPFERCAPIEAATDGAVMRWDLRPHDWWLHWPELVGVKGAPVAPEEAKAA